MRYKLTVEAAADLSRIVLPRDAWRPYNHAADDFWMAVFGHPPAKMPEVGTDRGFTGTVATSWPGGFTYGVREVDVRCVLWARWDLENGARADLERVNDALGAADHFILAVTGEMPPLLARALECVGAELVPDARPAPAGLLAAIQPSGRLHVPLGGEAAIQLSGPPALPASGGRAPCVGALWRSEVADEPPPCSCPMDPGETLDAQRRPGPD